MGWRRLLVASLVLATPGLGCGKVMQEPEDGGEIITQNGEVIAPDGDQTGPEAVADLPIDPDDGGSVAERLRDVSLAANVKLKLAEETGVDISMIDLQVQDGRVTLLGDVASREIGSRVVGAAQGVAGVKQVVSQLNAPDAPPPAPPGPTLTDSLVRKPTDSSAQAQPQQAEAPTPEYYTIKRGDNLGAIARKHGTTVAQLQRLNNITGTNIRAGQRLRVK